MQRGMLQPGAKAKGCRREKQRQEDNTWFRASGLKVRDTARLSHRNLTVRSTLKQLVPCCQSEQPETSIVKLGLDGFIYLFSKTRARKPEGVFPRFA